MAEFARPPTLHPLRERLCDQMFNNPALNTPPPEPEKPKPPHVRRPRQWKLPPKFALLSEDFYNLWCNHYKHKPGAVGLPNGDDLKLATCYLDARPPPLFPELYLKPRRLEMYARQLEDNMRVNKDLLQKINVIQKTGGFVDCWRRGEFNDEELRARRRCDHRQGRLDQIKRDNLQIYGRILVARSEQMNTKELDDNWKDVKQKLILGASLPFILFKTGRIDQDIRDPAFDKPPNVHRPKVALDIRVRAGAKIGKVTAELFSDVCPLTCRLFLALVRGLPDGHAYTDTSFFRIVPELYCRGGDVTKNNGFGTYMLPGESEYRKAENFKLKHSVPGVLSMAVGPDSEVYGHFNIIFKPLPQLDGKNVVFGRIVSGPVQALERISALGRPLGTTGKVDCMIHVCGISHGGRVHPGHSNKVGPGDWWWLGARW